MKDRKWILALVEEARSSGAGIERICELVGRSRRTLMRWRKDPRDDGRKTNRFHATNALTPAERKRVVDTLCSPRFRDMNPNVVAAILAEEGVYIASERTMYRVLEEEGLKRRRSDVRAPQRERPDELEATGPNQVWCWDITYILACIRGKFHYQYFISDIWDRALVGWAVHEEQSSEHASELLQATCEKHGIVPGQTVLHQDNGGPMISADFLASAKQFGVIMSYSRPGKCDDNAFAEALFKTEKYRPGYPRRFESHEELHEWTEKFVEWYNNEHRHSGIGYVTPMQRRTGEDVRILEKRRETYEAARRAARNAGRAVRENGNARKALS